MITLTLPGSVRSKKNSKQVFAGRRRAIVIPSKAYKEWEERAQIHAVLKLSEFRDGMVFPMVFPVHVKATFYYKGSRPDLSGAEESLGDCLERYSLG